MALSVRPGRSFACAEGRARVGGGVRFSTFTIRVQSDARMLVGGCRQAHPRGQVTSTRRRAWLGGRGEGIVMMLAALVETVILLAVNKYVASCLKKLPDSYPS